jgi:hypothetical protein
MRPSGGVSAGFKPTGFTGTQLLALLVQKYLPSWGHRRPSGEGLNLLALLVLKYWLYWFKSTYLAGGTGGLRGEYLGLETDRERSVRALETDGTSPEWVCVYVHACVCVCVYVPAYVYIFVNMCIYAHI